MENLEYKYNIISIDEDFIGKVGNLIPFFIENLVYNLQQNITNEEKISNIDIINEILQDLQNYELEYEVIRVCYNPMGTYYINDNLEK